jgi:predicted nucleic acid-binding protein
VELKGIKEKIIGIDTMVFIYHLEDHPDYADRTEYLFKSIESGKHNAVTSVITLIEILVKPMREGNSAAARDYRDLLLTFPHLRMVNVDAQISEAAAHLRAKYGIKTPDAIQIATVISQGSTSFITNDESLKKVEELTVLLLDDIGKRL